MDILLVGGGGHCRAVIDVIERTGRWSIAGIVDANLAKDSKVDGYAVLGSDHDLPSLRERAGHALITVGQIKSPDARMRIHSTLIELGFDLPVIVSPTADVSPRAVLGAGTVAMHFVFVGPGAAVGGNCILNTRSHVEHDCAIGDHCHVSTGAVLNGGVRIGEGSMIGSGSVVREGVAVGARCVVGMGSHLRVSIGDGTLFAGGLK